MDLVAGRKIDRYIAEQRLGEGGMAVVWKVRHESLGTVNALKILTLGHSSIRERFVSEGKLQASLRHTNIVAVYDLLDVDGSPALLIEYVDGPTLADRLEEPIPLADAEAWFRGICAGVAEAHRRGMVHRDLKPENVLLATIDGTVVPKVADFGLAKIAEDAQEGHTKSGVAMGTPAYMAPEQIRDAKRVDRRADLFSLGCILYEMVTLDRPFGGDDLLSILTAVSKGEYVPARERVKDLPERFEATIRAALQVDPDRRPADCAELLAILDGAPVKAVEPTKAATGPEVSRGTAAGAALGAAFITLVLSIPALVGLLAVGAWFVAGGGSTDSDTDASFLPTMTIPTLTVGCPDAKEGEIVGYVSHRGLLLKKRGGTWYLPAEKIVYSRRPTDVEKSVPGDADVVCRLPAGTKLVLVEAPQVYGATGMWIAVGGGSWTLPKADE